MLTERFPSYLNRFIEVESYSERIKVYALPSDNEMHQFLDSLKLFAEDKQCDKLIFYVKNQDRERSFLKSCSLEGFIKGFFQGKDAYIYSHFLRPSRCLSVDPAKEKKVIQQTLHVPKKTGRSTLPAPYTMRRPNPEDADEMAALYRAVFKTYPTPMHDPSFIKKVMEKDVYFTIVEYKGSIVSACSADVMPAFQSAEMSDCATAPEHRNQGLLTCQFSYLIPLMRKKKIWTLYSYSRSLSLGMNTVNVYHGFHYGGKMVRNSNISGQLESMNIWYKQLRRL